MSSVSKMRYHISAIIASCFVTLLNNQMPPNFYGNINFTILGLTYILGMFVNSILENCGWLRIKNNGLCYAVSTMPGFLKL